MSANVISCVTVGESSCAAKLPQGPGRGLPDDNGALGEALFSISELIRLAISRCKTAVCAVETMGKAAEEYGFYGEAMQSGEALTVSLQSLLQTSFPISHCLC